MTQFGNAQEVLERVEAKILILDSRKNPYYRVSFRIEDVYRELNIFDWWNDNLSLTQLKDMRKFLKEAIKLGYTGYVCFKVGATGCANGMWAYKKESTDGYSPKGDCIYKSFSPEYNYWQVEVDGTFYPQGSDFDSIKSIRDLERYMEVK